MASPVFDEITFYVSENASVNSNVGRVVASDADSDPVTYSITAGNTDSSFAIDSSSGLITVAAGLNYSINPTFTLTVQASDGSNTTEITVNIIVAEYTNSTQASHFTFYTNGGRTVAVRVNG